MMLQRVLNRGEARSDDTAEVFQKRMKVFEEETQEVIAWFRIHNKLIEIDGNGDSNEVH